MQRVQTAAPRSRPQRTPRTPNPRLARAQPAKDEADASRNGDGTPRVLPHVAFRVDGCEAIAPLRVFLRVAERGLQRLDMGAELLAQRADALARHIGGKPQHFFRILQQHPQILDDLLAAECELLRRVSHLSLLVWF